MTRQEMISFLHGHLIGDLERQVTGILNASSDEELKDLAAALAAEDAQAREEIQRRILDEKKAALASKPKIDASKLKKPGGGSEHVW